jgi:hypothetical protein
MESNQMFPEFLFEEPTAENNILLKYKYLVSADVENGIQTLLPLTCRKKKLTMKVNIRRYIY